MNFTNTFSLQVVLGDTLVSTSSKEATDQQEDESADYKWAVSLMLLTVLCSYFATAFNTGDNGADVNKRGWFIRIFENAFSLCCFITHEDKMAFVSSTVYVVYCCLRIMVSFGEDLYIP